VDEITPGSEGHHIVKGASGKARYRVGWESAEEKTAAESAATNSCSWIAMVAVASVAALTARRMIKST
jgi:hypothetical protein